MIEAEDGKVGVEMANKHKPDLILMDIKMPVMDGQEAILIIRETEAISKIPIIALTATIIEKTKIEVEGISDDYLQKPISRQQLFAKLGEFLKNKSQED